VLCLPRKERLGKTKTNFLFKNISLQIEIKKRMSEDATIEDDAEAEQLSATSQTQTTTGLLPWSYIFEIGKSKYVWMFFFIFVLI
jgi:hypothetical protein